MGRLIDAEKAQMHLVKRLFEVEKDVKKLHVDGGALLHKIGVQLLPTWFDECPTAVEIVRCKDCVHVSDMHPGGFYLWCTVFDCAVNRDSYCSRGEEK